MKTTKMRRERGIGRKSGSKSPWCVAAVPVSRQAQTGNLSTESE